MSRNHFVSIFLFCLCIETVTAKTVIDCRVITEDITECYPYGEKFLKAEEIVYDLDRKRLIRVKNLPRPEKKPLMRVISVEEMLDKTLKIQDSIRFKGGEKPLLLTSEVVSRSVKEPLILASTKKSPMIYGTYIVTKGDVLSRLAKKFGLKRKAFAQMNGLDSKASLYIGQKLKIPYEQKMVDALASAEYKVEDGDTLISIGNKFNLHAKALAAFNGIHIDTIIRIGSMIKLPLPYILAQQKRAEAKKKQRAEARKAGTVDLLQEFGKQSLRVTATAYSSHEDQTDSTPFLAAWNNRLRPGMKIIAVSRDMLTLYGMRNGTKVRIAGLPGYYTVRDKMNKRYKKRIDIYTGVDRRKALRWGRRSVVIYW